MNTYYIYSDGHDESIAVKCRETVSQTIYRKQKPGGTQRYQFTGYSYEAHSRDAALQKYYDE